MDKQRVFYIDIELKKQPKQFPSRYRFLILWIFVFFILFLLFPLAKDFVIITLMIHVSLLIIIYPYLLYKDSSS